MSQERDLLKSLLLKEELEVLNQLKEKILSQDQFTEEVAKVLATAIKRAEKNDASLQKALHQPIKKGVLKAFSESKQSIIDAILPIMGTLIRKTVSNSIKQIVGDINRALEQRFNFKWRWQAFKAGTTYAEMVFKKTIRYQVQELFLINRNNGLLIEHAGDDELLKDNNAISAMLTVIQDFIRDSLQSPDADLLSTEIGDKVILISQGPQAFLASIIKGAPTERLKEKSQQLIENIHAEFSLELSEDDSYRKLTNLKEYLKKHLILKNISSAEKKINWIPWLVIPMLFVIWLSYVAYNRNQEFNKVVQLAEDIDGFYLQSIERQKNGFKVSGLLDPLADMSPIQDSTIELNTRPFISLDASILDNRINRVVRNYQGISVVRENNKVFLSGIIMDKKKNYLLQSIMSITGIDEVVDQLTLDKSKQIEALLHGYHLNYQLTNEGLRLKGKIKYQDKSNLLNQLTLQFPKVNLNIQGLDIIDSTQIIIDNISQTLINIPKFEANDSKSQMLVNNLINNLQLLLQRESIIEIEIVGTSDCNGSKSDEFSQFRALQFINFLIEKGFENHNFKPSVDACENFNNKKSLELQNIRVNVITAK